MATVEQIFSKLSVDSSVSAILGYGSTCRCYFEIAPPSAERPFVVIQHIGSQMAPTHSEANGSRFDLVQIACFAETFVAARDLGDAITAALDNQALASGEKPILEDVRSSYDTAVDLHRRDVDFLI